MILIDVADEALASDAEQFRGVDLIAACFLERLNDQLALDGWNDFQFRVAFGQLKQLLRERSGVCFASWEGHVPPCP